MTRRSTPYGAHALAAAALTLLVGAGEPGGGQPPPEKAPCSLPTMVDDLRAALQDGSPALQRYMKVLLKEIGRASCRERV